MSEIRKLLCDYSFTKTLLESLPCGVVVITSDGRVVGLNTVMEHALGITARTTVGKPIGHAFGCLDALDTPEGCGFSDLCKNCQLKNLAFEALSKNQRQKARIYLQVILDGRVRDVALLLSAAPLTFDGKRFGIVIIENVNKVSSITTPDMENGFRGILSQDAKMKELFELIRQIASTDAPVLVQGESGTGKELVALAIHKESHRAKKHFVPVNCGALPEGLLESELFGHVKGAFTGAIQNKRGRFEVADGGSIFLDEVGELSPSMQVKFLRILQDGAFERLGSEQTLKVNVRVISATNKNLEREVETGRFRQDLFYRLCVVPVTIPPLRDRPGDIPLLADHFLAQFCEELCRPKLVLSESAMGILTNHTWPGNVRELQNVLQFSAVRCQREMIEAEHLPPNLPAKTSLSSAVNHQGPKLQTEDVAEALRKSGGNKLQAAKILGVSRSTLYRFFGNH